MASNWEWGDRDAVGAVVWFCVESRKEGLRGEGHMVLVDRLLEGAPNLSLSCETGT
jgi:hypothetical protein